ncbi:hypothetical protein K466DRAFT_607525 [Polyporus arcularius HHB13444]|uniref:Uncharacterized protein n=1 Tax=Polyporus arcularius HHB13444 TaxID=1314778 RepID=A0A5C3NNR0_9APHY|nr:hypothetical protein K466DRAFT_607525 [Polyporus arcularius HHB13444]
MASHIDLSQLRNVFESVGAQAGGPYIDHHDERSYKDERSEEKWQRAYPKDCGYGPPPGNSHPFTPQSLPVTIHT